MGHRVDAGQRTDASRLRHSQLGVEYRDPKRRLLIPACHLHVRFGVRDQGKGLGLAAGARRSGHADRRQHRLGGLAEALVVGHRAAVGQQEIDPLGAVHRAAAADRDQKIDFVVLGDRSAHLHVPGSRVLLDGVEKPRLEPRLFAE